MTEGVAIFFILVGVVIISAVLFSVWVVAMLVKLVLRGVSGLFGSGVSGSPQALVSGPTFTCTRKTCRSVNPASARFCRRCGQELLRGPRAMRQAALW